MGSTQRSESASVLTKPLKVMKAALDVSNRVKDSITLPLAERAVGYWCSGEKYERACLDQAYVLTDHAIMQATKTMEKGADPAGMESQQFKTFGDLVRDFDKARKGIGVMGTVIRGGGTGFKWFGDCIGSASNSMFNYGLSLRESNHRFARWTGKALTLSSYLPWGASYAPAAVSYVLIRTGKTAELTSEALDLRKRMAEKVFLPMILRGNAIGKTRAVQGCLNIGVNAGYLYATGLLNANSWAELASEAVSTGKKCIFVAEALVGGWIWKPTLTSTVDVARACCKRKQQIEQLKTELLRVNPNLGGNCYGIPGGIDLFLGLFLESNSFLLGYLINSPEEFIQMFCDWSEVGGMAVRIAIQYGIAGERN